MDSSVVLGCISSRKSLAPSFHERAMSIHYTSMCAFRVQVEGGKSRTMSWIAFNVHAKWYAEVQCPLGTIQLHRSLKQAKACVVLSSSVLWIRLTTVCIGGGMPLKTRRVSWSCVCTASCRFCLRNLVFFYAVQNCAGRDQPLTPKFAYCSAYGTRYVDIVSCEPMYKHHRSLTTEDLAEAEKMMS
jgi:hypothetical protein